MPPLRVLTIPLRGSLLPGTPIERVWADLPLLVKTTGNSYVAKDFRVDTGAHITEVDWTWAYSKGVSLQGTFVNWPVTTGAGTSWFRGELGTIRVRLPMWRGTEFEGPCFFRHNRPANLPFQLGLAGVIKDIRLSIDGIPTPRAPFGSLKVEVL